MKTILLIITMIAVSQASIFKYAGKYQLGKSVIEVRESKNHNGDIDFDFNSKNGDRDCGAFNVIPKNQIKNNLVDYREDNGYGMRKTFDLKFTEGEVDIKFTNQYVADSQCGEEEGKAFSGKFIKIAK